MAETERRIRSFLGDWRFWVGIAYFGLACVVVALWWWNGKLNNANRRVARDEAVHAAEIQANTTARMAQCLQSRPELERINRFILGVQAAEQVLLVNSKAQLALTLPTDPLYKVRVANLRRLERAAKDVRIPLFPIPTDKQCGKH